jgi:predicted alpha/beta superfamily hydrolase
MQINASTNMQFKLIRQTIFILLLAACFASAAQAQLTLTLTSVPSNTPKDAVIYVAGTFNNWAPGDPAFALKKGENGRYGITLNPPAGMHKFKFTRGAWANVEGNASGTFRPDRVLDYDGKSASVELSVLSWEDLGPGNPTNPNSTAAPNVKIISNAFNIPQLNRNRRVWIYLPPDYETSTKKYPVLYLHDAQNLFDVTTGAFGEWKIDETLNEKHKQGDYGCIAVGVDNGGGERLNEYSPWINTQYGGGLGDEYVDFLVNTLKPYIDANYRTLPGRNATGIMGSSMGGLLSMYALSERQDVFSKAGIFSPAFWFAGNKPVEHVASRPKKGAVKVYFLAGGAEPAYVASDMKAVSDAMKTAGFGDAEKRTLIPSDGQHSEWFWAREFPAAYTWLFAGAATSTKNKKRPKKTGLQIFPNPAGSWVRIAGLEPGEPVDVQIVGADGRLWHDATQRSDAALWTGDLPGGFYVVKLRTDDETGWTSEKLIVAE